MFPSSPLFLFLPFPSLPFPPLPLSTILLPSFLIPLPFLPSNPLGLLKSSYEVLGSAMVSTKW